MKQIHKEYERAFLLEKTKLDRLMDIIHGLLGEHKSTTKHDDFEVFLSGQRREEMTSVDDVLNLDNSRKSKIQRLLITCFASTERGARPDHEIQVDFDGRNIGKNKTKVTVSVKSDDSGWSARALSEVEEQVERTSLEDSASRGVLWCLFIGVLFVIGFLLLSSFAGLNSGTGRDADAMWLRVRDVERIEQILKQQRTLTDEEMREIATTQLRNVVLAYRESRPSGLTRQKAYIGVPLLVVLGCVIYLIGLCYPTAVFLWGDEVERNAKMLHTRRVLWGLIISGIGFGVLSKFFVAGVVSGP
ncbi:MAG: hypothetical protein WD042_03350 [Phycisphaeraceae bacterium]